MEATYEKLGVFYLGKKYDLESGEVLKDEPTLLRSKDLTTHALCVGMTGSGKTGLCVSLLEEAAIDNIPVIAIDPKGDIANLLLTFDKMTPENFKPWIDPSEAEQKGVSVEELATQKAELWKNGIASWDQGPERIKRLKENVDLRIYTPGSEAGCSLSLYGDLKAPTKSTIEDPGALSELVQGVVTSYLSVVDGCDSEAGSPEHTYLSEVVLHFWRKREPLNLEELIGAIQNPPFDKIGALSLDSFFNKSARSKLALKFNALYASPQFQSWSKGEGLSVSKLLYGEGGKAKVSILSLSHLEEQERVFFVSRVLNELVSWTRKQSGTSSLRALVYMDEVYGYFPPNGNPPTKKPMLTLLKQARAQGVGVVLATQNPVDLDYKGLSNIGTWFIGRLQTERDKERLLEGLKSIESAGKFDFRKTLSSLDKRVFLMHSVHRGAPEVFHTRWALSYLSGPITLDKIKVLMKPFKSMVQSGRVQNESSKEKSFDPGSLPKEIPQKVFSDHGGHLTPKFGVVSSTYFLHKKSGSETELSQVWLSDVDASQWEWQQEGEVSALTGVKKSGDFFFEQPASCVQEESIYKKLSKDAKGNLYREARVTLYESPLLKEFSQFDESLDEFKGRLSHALREKKDEAIDKLNSKFEKRMDMIEKRVLRAEQKVEKEKEQYANKKTNTLLGIGTAVASLFLGGKALSGANARRAGSVLKSVGSASKEKGDIARAEEQLKDHQEDLEKLQMELEEEILKLEEEFSSDAIELKEHLIKPTKSNIDIKWVGLIWV